MKRTETLETRIMFLKCLADPEKFAVLINRLDEFNLTVKDLYYISLYFNIEMSAMESHFNQNTKLY